jgi:hypothetical protein
VVIPAGACSWLCVDSGALGFNRSISNSSWLCVDLGAFFGVAGVAECVVDELVYEAGVSAVVSVVQHNLAPAVAAFECGEQYACALDCDGSPISAALWQSAVDRADLPVRADLVGAFEFRDVAEVVAHQLAFFSGRGGLCG